MPYIQVTTEAERSFARDADAMSGRIDNRGMQASNIFTDNAAADAALPYIRESQQMLLDRAQVLEAGQRTRSRIQQDDMTVADEKMYEVFKEGLGDLPESQRNNKIGTALLNDPTSVRLRAAREAFDNTSRTGGYIAENAFKLKELGNQSIKSDYDMELFAELRSERKQTELLKSGNDLKQAQLMGAKMNESFTGTVDELERSIGAAGLNQGNQEAISSLIRVLDVGDGKNDPSTMAVYSALHSIMNGVAAKQKSGKHFARRIASYKDDIDDVSKEIGVDKNNQLLDPFDQSPEVQTRLRLALAKNPALVPAFNEVSELKRNHEANNSSIATLEAELPKHIRTLIDKAKNRQMSPQDFAEELGAFKAKANIFRGHVAETIRLNSEDFKLRMDDTKVEVLNRRMANMIETGKNAEARLELAKEYQDIRDQMNYMNRFMSLDRVKKMDPKKFQAFYNEIEKEAAQRSSKNAPSQSGGGGDGYSGVAPPP